MGCYSIDGSGNDLYNQNAATSHKAVHDRREFLVWIFKGARYPHISRSEWITRTWLLIRKVINQNNTPTWNDVRVAKVLINFAPRISRPPAHLLEMLEEVIINGPTSTACPHCAAAAQEDLGSYDSDGIRPPDGTSGGGPRC